VHWVGDFYYGKNLAIATVNNTYLDGLAWYARHLNHCLRFKIYCVL